jgi:hypothetical protein
MRTLRDALKEGTCRWKSINAEEKKAWREEYERQLEDGEIVEKDRRCRSDAGTARGPNKASKSKRASGGKGKSKAVSGDEDSEEDVDEWEDEDDEEDEDEDDVENEEDDADDREDVGRSKTSKSKLGSKSRGEKEKAKKAREEKAREEKSREKEAREKERKAKEKDCAEFGTNVIGHFFLTELFVYWFWPLDFRSSDPWEGRVGSGSGPTQLADQCCGNPTQLAVK